MYVLRLHVDQHTSSAEAKYSFKAIASRLVAIYNLNSLRKERACPKHFKGHAKGKKEWYVPALNYCIDFLRQRYPAKYMSRTRLDILYEFCEFNKVVYCILNIALLIP